MSNSPKAESDDMRLEYDFSNAVRGKFAKRFPSDAVNAALRVLMTAAKKVAPAA